MVCSLPREPNNSSVTALNLLFLILKNDPVKAELFVRFYLQALTLVAGTDTFQTFLMKLKAMDAAEFKSQFTLLLEEEMLARGMSLN